MKDHVRVARFEPEIVINGEQLTEGQALSVRVAVSSFRMELHMYKGKRMKELGDIGPHYDARLYEVERIMLGYDDAQGEAGKED